LCRILWLPDFTALIPIVHTSFLIWYPSVFPHKNVRTEDFVTCLRALSARLLCEPLLTWVCNFSTRDGDKLASLILYLGEVDLMEIVTFLFLARFVTVSIIYLKDGTHLNHKRFFIKYFESYYGTRV
jgi:hypothetical protein